MLDFARELYPFHVTMPSSYNLYPLGVPLSASKKAMQPYAGYLPEESIWGKSKGTLLRFSISGFSISRTHRSNRFIKSYQKLIRG